MQKDLVVQAAQLVLEFCGTPVFIQLWSERHRVLLVLP